MNLYTFTRPPATIGLSVYYRKIHFTGAENIPTDKPILIAANHPTAFLDSCLLACFQERELHFLARGDFFVNRIASAILNSLNIIPIFRLKDGGYKNIKQNYTTFARCFEQLHANKAIMILAEGGTKHEKRLRPLQKGTARIAFGALERYPDMDLQIVPVSLNYTYAERYRSEVMIKCAEPIAVKDYLAIHQENPNRGARQLLLELKKRLSGNLVIIEKEEDEWLVEQLFQLHRHEQVQHFFPLLSTNSLPLEQEIAIANQINQASEKEKEKLTRKIKIYNTALQQENVTDFGLLRSKDKLTTTTLFLLLTFPFFLIGYIANYLPLRLSKWIGDTYSPHITFYASITACSGMVLWLIYFFTLLIISGLSHFPVNIFSVISIAILLPILGYFALFYQHQFHYWNATRQAKKLKLSCQKKLLQLRPRPVV